MNYINIDAQKCTGCRACEIACSYHHKHVFNPRIASLEIRISEKWPSISVLLYEDMTNENRKKRIPCDFCKNEQIALCMKYCPVGAIKLNDIGDISNA
jgi:Fe-S-cluster-containing dehydrogenase component